MIDENLIDRVYDALPKMPRTNEPYYSRSAIRLILTAGYNITFGGLADAESCPIPPPEESTLAQGSGTYNFCGAVTADQIFTNEGILDIRATASENGFEYSRSQGVRTEPLTYGDVLPGLMRWLVTNHPEKAEELERDGDLAAHPPLESETRGRVRDELELIFTGGLTPGIYAKECVDRILDKLIEHPNCYAYVRGWLRAVQNGEDSTL